jgi:tetratricopeptide (TPR) repeat protein
MAMMQCRLSSLRVLATYQPPYSDGRNTGQECLRYMKDETAPACGPTSRATGPALHRRPKYKDGLHSKAPALTSSQMKRATLVSPATLNRIFQEVNEAWKRCDFQSAIELMERTGRRDPANAGLLLDLGRMYGQRHDYAAAERCFERALRITGQKTEMLAAAGERSFSFSNFSLAESYLKRALERNDVSPATIVKLAEVHERNRRMEEAAGLADRALRADSACAPALLLRARLDRQAGRLEAAEQRLRTFPANADPSLRASAAYEMGGILDRQGRYDEAMAAFLAAKDLLRPNAAPHLAELKIVRQRLQAMQAALNADAVQRWLAAAPDLPPPRRVALLAGHPRSGTTLLEQVLDSHPDIVSAEETEIFHFDAYIPLTRSLPLDSPMFEVLESASIGALLQSRNQYFETAEKFLNQPVGGRLLIDKNPSLTFLIPALIRIFPEIRLLIALRDPRDVVLSCFMQSIPLSQVSSAYLRLESTVAEYAAMMNLWQALKPMIAGHFLEARYEDMVEDLESVARKALDFLGVPWNADVLGFDAHARQKVVRSPTYADVTQPVYKRAVGRWHHYQKYLEPHLEKLEPFVKAFGYEL